VLKIQVLFFTVRNASDKVRVLKKTVESHSASKENIAIISPDFKTIEFISDLLWSHPKTSFLPHSCSLALPMNDRVLIATAPLTQESYPFVFNLCPSPQSLPPTVKILYELEDLSHPNKVISFQEKLQFYKNKNYIISST
jgi:DNA polymerase IIIc chi subunit